MPEAWLGHWAPEWGLFGIGPLIVVCAAWLCRNRQRRNPEFDLGFGKRMAASPDASLVCRDGRVILANPAAARLWKAPSPEDLAGKSVLELVDSGGLAESLGAGAGPDFPVRLLEGKIRAVDGASIDVELAVASFWDGGKAAIAAVVRDIPERARPVGEMRHEIRAHIDGATGLADAAVPPSAASSARQARILVAEDNSTNQEVILAMLSRLGHQADAVADGVQALAALQQADYDLVLMDCWMPEMDGFETARRIRQPASGVRNPGIPIVALTADVLPHVREDCLQAGMSDYLTKPLDLRELERRLGQWLRPVAPDRQPVFDRDGLMERLMGNEDLAHRVVTRFLDTAPAQLAALAAAVAMADAQSAWKAAHSIKGAAANAGGSRLSEAARRLESLGRQGDLTGAGSLSAEVEREFAGYRAQAGKEWGPALQSLPAAADITDRVQESPWNRRRS